MSQERAELLCLREKPLLTALLVHPPLCPDQGARGGKEGFLKKPDFSSMDVVPSGRQTGSIARRPQEAPAGPVWPLGAVWAAPITLQGGDRLSEKQS